MERTWLVQSGALVEADRDTASIRPDDGDAAGCVMLVEPEAALERCVGTVASEIVRALPHAAVSFIEREGDEAAGIVVIPSARRRQREASRFAFIMRARDLVLVDNGDSCASFLDHLVTDRVRIESAQGAFIAMIRLIVKDHPAKLARIREDFEIIEELVLDGRRRVNRALMMEDTRRMLGLDGFYQGILDILDSLAEDETGLIAAADCTRLQYLARQVERLSTRLEALQDYCLQVQSFYQESIDVRQNNVMQWLTVVATIAMPLTFITGWYGMNFPHMVLFDAPWGYPAVVVVCGVIVTLEVAFFHRRGWLRFGGNDRHRHHGDC